GTVLGGEVGGTTTTGGGTTGGTTTKGGGPTGGITTGGGLTPIGGGGTIGGKKACACGTESVNGTKVSVAVGTSSFQRVRRIAFSLPTRCCRCGSCRFLRLCGPPGFNQRRRSQS